MADVFGGYGQGVVICNVLTIEDSWVSVFACCGMLGVVGVSVFACYGMLGVVLVSVFARYGMLGVVGVDVFACYCMLGVDGVSIHIYIECVVLKGDISNNTDRVAE